MVELAEETERHVEIFVQQAPQMLELLRVAHPDMPAIDPLPLFLVDGASYGAFLSLHASCFRRTSLKTAFTRGDNARIFTSGVKFNNRANLALGLLDVTYDTCANLIDTRAVWYDCTLQNRAFKMKSAGKLLKGPGGKEWFDSQQLLILSSLSDDTVYSGNGPRRHFTACDEPVKVAVAFVKTVRVVSAKSSNVLPVNLELPANMELRSGNVLPAPLQLLTQLEELGPAQLEEVKQFISGEDDAWDSKDKQDCIMMPNPQMQEQLVMFQDQPIVLLQKVDIVTAYRRKFPDSYVPLLLLQNHKGCFILSVNFRAHSMWLLQELCSHRLSH
jgi:hypothetical protein